MDSRDEALLVAEHFAADDNGLWIYRQTYHNQDTGRHRKIAVVVEELPDGRFAGYIPMVDDHIHTKGTNAVPASGYRHVSEDIRDMVALALGEKAAAMMDLYDTQTETGFEHGEIFVSSPFHRGQRLTRAIAGQSRDMAYFELVSPALDFGQSYVDWRDEYCSEKLADMPASKTR